MTQNNSQSVCPFFSRVGPWTFLAGLLEPNVLGRVVLKLGANGNHHGNHKTGEAEQAAAPDLAHWGSVRVLPQKTVPSFSPCPTRLVS
jgi:hypothetical protein